MKKISTKINKILTSIFALLILIAVVAPSASAYTQKGENNRVNYTVVAASAFSGSKDAVCNGVGLGGNACSSSSNGSSDINKIISNVLNILSYIVGIAAVLMIIISGFRIIVSGGDSNSFNSAKNGILHAIIGLVIVAAAQIIVQYVLKNATS